MDRLDTLWKYQELDLAMDQFILDKKNSDLRQKLLKLRDYLVKQEDTLLKLDEEAEQKTNTLNKVQNDYNEISSTIKSRIEKLQAGKVSTVDELEELTKEGLMLKDKIRKKEDELNKLMKELNNFQTKLNDIRQKVAKAKKEYTDVKKVYDDQVAKINEELAELKQKRDKLGASIDNTLMTKYKNIKASKTPVISQLVDNQCGGCFMSLASLVVQKVKDGNQIVECENCGRILYYKE